MKKVVKVIRIILIVVSSVVLCYCIYKLYPNLKGYKESGDAYKKITEEAIKKPDRTLADSEEKEDDLESAPTDSLKIDWEALGKNVVGWLQLDDIGYPIMQANDNNYYLHRLPDGTYNYGGSLFLLAENKSTFIDANSIVYGHNMANGSMFGNLKRYKDSKYANHTFDIYLPDGTRHQYKFSSVVHINVNSDVYTYAFADDEEFIAYQEKMKNMSMYQNDYNISSNARYVTLSTCDGYEGTTNRLVVQGIESKVWQVQ